MTTLPMKLHLGPRNNLVISKYDDLLKPDMVYFTPSPQNIIDIFGINDTNTTAKNIASLLIVFNFSLHHRQGDEIPKGIEIDYNSSGSIRAFTVGQNRLDMNLLSNRYFGIKGKYRAHFEMGKNKILPTKVFLGNNVVFQIKPETLLQVPKDLQIRSIDHSDTVNFREINLENPSEDDIASMIVINANLPEKTTRYLDRDMFLVQFKKLENKYREFFGLTQQLLPSRNGRATSPGARATSPNSRIPPLAPVQKPKDLIPESVSCTTAPLGNPAMFRTSGISNREVAFMNRFASILKTQYMGNVQQLKVNTLGEIRKVTGSLKTNSVAFDKVKIIMGIDALHLASMDIAKNGVLQVASQFNFLESTSNAYTPISEYSNDWTQGPRASLSVPASLVIRDFQFEKSDPSVGFFVSSNANYRGGYYVPSPFVREAFNEYLEISQNIEDLPILVQDGFDSLSNNLVTQIFCAAPSFQNAKAPDETSIQALICNTLMSAQYEAAARVAVHKSLVTKAEVPLHLTLVGQGAFNNNKSAIMNGISKVISIIGSHNVKVYIHVYGQNDFDKLPVEIRGFPQVKI